MRTFQTINTKTARVGAVAMAAVLASCGYAKRDYVDGEMTRLRQEVQDGDRAVAGRVDQLEGRVTTLERDLQSLRSEFNVTVERLEGLLAFNVPVNFEFDDATVRPSDQPVLDRFAAVVKEYYPNAVVTVEGFTDPAGSRTYNMKLGMARAEAVLEYLTTVAGLTGDQVRAVSYGEAPERLVVPGAEGPESGVQNRRVSLVIDYSGAPIQREAAPITDQG